MKQQMKHKVSLKNSISISKKNCTDFVEKKNVHTEYVLYSSI